MHYHKHSTEQHSTALGGFLFVIQDNSAIPASLPCWCVLLHTVSFYLLSSFLWGPLYFLHFHYSCAFTLLFSLHLFYNPFSLSQYLSFSHPSHCSTVILTVILSFSTPLLSLCSSSLPPCLPPPPSSPSLPLSLSSHDLKM